MADLSAADLAAYSAQKQAAATTYSTGLANIQYQRGITGQNYGNQQYDLAHQYALTRERLPGQYAHRGLLNSGIYGHTLGLANEAQQTALGRSLQGYQQQLGQYDLQGQQLGGQYNDAMSNIEAQAALRREQLAQQLMNLA